MRKAEVVSVIIILASIAFLATIAGINYSKSMNSDPKFKIYEERCWNEPLDEISNEKDCAVCVDYNPDQITSISQEKCERVEIKKSDYENFTLDDCYTKFWKGNSSTDNDEYKSYMVCANILSPYLHKVVVGMRDGEEYEEDVEFYLKNIGCEINEWCGNYFIEVKK